MCVHCSRPGQQGISQPPPLERHDRSRRSCNGQLRDPDVNRLLENAAHTKVATDCDAYNRPAFLPCAILNSDRIQGEFLHLLYILADRRTRLYFANLGDDEVLTWRRAQFCWQHRAAIGLANAMAIARHAHLAPPSSPPTSPYLFSTPRHEAPQCPWHNGSGGLGGQCPLRSPMHYQPQAPSRIREPPQYNQPEQEPHQKDTP